MSALPPKADIDRHLWNIRYGPNSIISSPLKMKRHAKSQLLGGLEIDNQLKLGIGHATAEKSTNLIN
jgi:hypothetical protein